MRLRLAAALLALALSGTAGAKTILFVGNSFTYGAGTPVQNYRPDAVTDLNGEQIGGVPALFRTFAEQLRLDWEVSLETSPGKDLAWHLANHGELLTRKWDAVLLQGYSTLDAEHPGDPARHIAAAKDLSALAYKANSEVRIWLVSTWSRADLTYPDAGHWHGQPIGAMAEQLQAANCGGLAQAPRIGGVIPVGAAWNLAIRSGLADPDPYDGIAPGKVDLWGKDHYHASVEGYYLEALVEFGAVTSADPRRLGRRERGAQELGIAPNRAVRLQQIAARQLRLRTCR
ncbi:MAG: PEP-CTERM sorting domain-containing protein [Novosphingobium sp.]